MIQKAVKWVIDDFNSHKLRFCIEVIAWLLSVGCSITMALTVPNPPLIKLYIAWILGCSLYAWATWTRKSFGMFANYLFLASIDLIGLIRMLFF